MNAEIIGTEADSSILTVFPACLRLTDQVNTGTARKDDRLMRNRDSGYTLRRSALRKNRLHTERSRGSAGRPCSGRNLRRTALLLAAVIAFSAVPAYASGTGQANAARPPSRRPRSRKRCSASASRLPSIIRWRQRWRCTCRNRPYTRPLHCGGRNRRA